MKKLIFILAVLVLLYLLSVQAAGKGPKLLAVEQIDLGKVQAGQILEQTLSLQNIGDADLAISSITSDCPCTSFQALDKDENYQPLQFETRIMISPGEKEELKLIFDSNKTKYLGVFKKLILIGSNDSEAPIMKVEMIGELAISE